MHRWSWVQAIKRNSFFFRVLIYFLSLLTISVSIGIIIYLNAISAIKDDFSAKVSSNLNTSVKTVDTYLQTSEQVGINFFRHDTPQMHLFPNDQMTVEDRVQLPNIIKLLLLNHHVISDYTSRVFLYMDDAKVYSNKGLDDFEVFFNKFYTFERYDIDFWESKLQSDQTLELLAPSTVKRINAEEVVIPIITVDTVNGHKAVMVTSLSVHSIYQSIKGNFIFPSTQFIILDSNDNIVISSSSDYSKREFINQMTPLFTDDDRQATELSFQNENLVINYSTSDAYGWQYYAITPAKEIHAQATEIFTVTIIICILLILIATIIACVYSIHLYNPIRNIKNILVDMEGGSNDTSTHSNNKSEFEVIGTGINRLMTEHDEIKHKYETISNDYLDQIITSLIRGDAQEEESLQEKVHEDLKFEKNSYVCCTVLFEFKDEFYSEVQDVDRLIIMENLKELTWAILKQYVPIYLIQYRQNLYVGAVNIENDQDVAVVKHAVNKLIETFKFDFKYCRISAGIGKRYEGLNQIFKSYNDAITALERREKSTDFQIIDSKDLPIEYHFHYTFADENKIINCLKANDLDCVKEVITEIIYLNKEKGVAPHYMDMLFVELYTTGKRYVAEQGLERNQMISDDEHYILSSKGSFPFEYEQRLQLLFEFYSMVIQQTSRDHIDQKTGSLVSFIMGYVQEHYHENLHLEQIAEEINLSAKYISRMFKEKTDMNLTDYISKTRIDQAKKLLVNTNRNISQISEEVGIYSRSTFLRLFKKYEGVSPGAYRKARQKL